MNIAELIGMVLIYNHYFYNSSPLSVCKFEKKIAITTTKLIYGSDIVDSKWTR